MIVKKMKKVLSSIAIAAYLIVYAAPMGMCVSAVPKIDARIGVQKPALRKSAPPTFLKLEGDLSISKSNPRINLSLRNSDVKQVLRMFADKAGLNIIFHSSVAETAPASGSTPASTSSGPTVTLDLVNVPLNEAFKMVLQVSGLTYYLENNTLVIATAEAAKNLNLAKQEMMVIPVKYIDAAVMADFLDKNIFSLNRPGLSNANIVITNPGTNEIIIFGTKNDYNMAKKVVTQFDVKPLEETFVVNHTTPKEMSELLCETLFQKFTGSSATSGSSSGGAAPVQNGVMTGGAASSSSEASEALTLGAGVVACQYKNTVSADKLSSLSTNNFTITYFPQRGTINALGGSAQQMQMVKDFILKNDKKQPQAYLEISLIELSEDGSREFTNNWAVYSNFFSGTFDGATTTNPLYPTVLGQGNYGVVTDPAVGAVSQNIPYISGAPSITYSMNYLISNGKGRLLANPRIVITNGENSKIDLSSDYIKMVTSQIVTNSVSNTPTVQKTYTIGTDEGIIVNITPFISPDGYVSLNIKPEYSTIKQEVKELNAQTNNIDLVATLLQRRNLDLKNVRIKDGETLVIGGMMREEEHKTISKLPVLGDLPGVGMFFRNTSTTKSKEELVIMITPKIIKDTEDVVSNPSTTL